MRADEMPKTEDFRRALEEEFRQAASLGRTFVEVRAGDLHRKVGHYPSHNHRMPVACGAMYGEVRDGDEILSRPPKGKGATLTIRYRLPRRG
ncbi:hypothetical protein [Calidithermus timidus]|uniref:hypothetical protein n=1 Tax=Calidithermus timidus TaxID=307124 RepID=UPI000371842E|nr:hypothetical protein [Calidithermus timidus]